MALDSNNTSFRFGSRVEPRLILVLFMFVWSGMAWTMTAFLGYGIVTEPLKYPELIAAWVVILAAAVLSTSWILWQLRGKEIFEITDQGLMLWHANALFKNRLFLRLDEIESIKAEANDDTPWWIRHQWGIGGGSIVVHHNGRKRRWGIDLPRKRADAIAKEMRSALDERLR